MKQKAVSLVALIVTMIVIIIIATIATINSMEPIDEGFEMQFKNNLKEVVNTLDVYQNRAVLYGESSYRSDDLYWDGQTTRAEHTAKITDGTQEDKIEDIFSGEVPASLRGKIQIVDGKIRVLKEFPQEYQWATEMYQYMAY